MTNRKIIDTVLAAVRKYDEAAHWVPEWATRNPSIPIVGEFYGLIVANFNHCPEGWDRKLANIGFEPVFYDEIITCSECALGLQTRPDWYGWLPDYWLDEEHGDVICRECLFKVHGMIDAYFEYAKDRPNRALLPTLISEELLAKNGWRKMNADRFENGFHPGQNDRPTDILAEYSARYTDYEFVFRVRSVGQFDTLFDLYGRKRGVS